MAARTYDEHRRAVHAAARELLAHGARTERALYTDDRIWWAVEAAGFNTDEGRYWSDLWLLEVAEPYEGEGPGRLWRLRREGVDVGR